MKIGICTSIENIKTVEELGFDYIELAAETICRMSDEDYAKALEEVRSSRIKPECFNILFSGDFALLSKDLSMQKVEDYLEKAFSRVQELGGELVVFGNGRLRSKDSDTLFETGYRQLINLVKIIGTVAARHDITVVIEPLNKDETNMINSVTEGAMLAATVDSPNIGLLADSYHMFKENEPISNIILVGKLLHTHIARLENRGFPTLANEQINSFIEALKEIKYDSRISIEGNAADFKAEGALALKLLREMFC